MPAEASIFFPISPKVETVLSVLAIALPEIKVTLFESFTLKLPKKCILNEIDEFRSYPTELSAGIKLKESNLSKQFDMNLA